MLDAELLVELRAIISNHTQMRFFDRNEQVGVVPGFSFVKCAENCDFQFFSIAYISEFAAISQLLFEQVVVAIKFALNREERLDVGHFPQRLDVHHLEGTIVGLWRHIL